MAKNKKTEHLIYSNYDVYSKENLQEAKSLMHDNGFKDDEITEEMLYGSCRENDADWYSCEYDVMVELDEKCNEIIAIAQLGLWNGIKSGYKEYKHLQDIMGTSCDSEKIYVDGKKNLRKVESHHDGNNSILYRQWKDNLSDEQKWNFENKIYEGTVTQADITRYTKSIGQLFADYYGW